MYSAHTAPNYHQKGLRPLHLRRPLQGLSQHRGHPKSHLCRRKTVVAMKVEEYHQSRVEYV